MSRKSKKILFTLFIAFAVAFIALAHFFTTYTEKYAITEAEKSVKDALLTHRAIHKYVTKVSRPEIYRIKAEGKLYEDYFSPKTMSFTYTARGIKNYLNEERVEAGLPVIYFKLATTNPRNKINEADEKEATLLKQMNAEELDEYKEIVHQADGNRYLYYALATEPMVKGCLKCHGEPEAAPAEMVAQYPKAAGYYEKVGDIRALISIRIPLETYLADGKKVSNQMLFISFLVLSVIYLISWYFIRETDRQHLIIASKNQELEKHKNNLESLVAERTEDLVHAKEEAEKANQAKSQFLANMSHELRTPMHAIHSFTHLALKREKDEKNKHFLENIDTSTQRLTDLLNDLLDLSKLEAGKMELELGMYDLSEITVQSIKQLEGLMQSKGLKVNSSKIESVSGEFDRKLIFHVITNLLSNAIKFSPAKSIVTIQTKENKIDGGDYLIFSIQDHGVGIPQQELTTIFDAFVQSSKTKTNAGGTGLGLPICKEIIELHHGKIWVESPVSGNEDGSIFLFQIPVKYDDSIMQI